MISKFALALGTLLMSTPLWAYGNAVTTSDRALLEKLAQADNAEIQLGQLVQQKTTQPAVRAYGQRLVSDHTAHLSNIQAFDKDHKVEVNATPTSEETALATTLSNKTGTDFDQTFIKGMLDDHKKDVDTVAKYIDEHPTSAITPMLKKSLPVLEDHLRLAENVAGQLGVSAAAGLTDSTAASS